MNKKLEVIYLEKSYSPDVDEETIEETLNKLVENKEYSPAFYKRTLSTSKYHA